ncbi:ribonuclease [Saccharopolyspora karakumensis]|uniref:Ribonuclease n=1 Tax=Saccharopolyspora karakumensis TaxID=2530386 RepID=A0A4R5B9P3_9PSEU|nr:ribonuclease domain-containing protein [Saccharopolyspora karakumensis]TDD83088.1 ribonuclease [Saccharopolyspora karakumensis]
MMKSVQILLAALLAVAGLVGFQSSAFSAAPAPAAVVAQAECGDTTGFDQVPLSSLPPEAAETVELIKAGGPFPYPEDGQTFGNREGLLPDCADGYYKEYTVETPGSDDRGARRFVVGEAGEFFWTQDHYETFALTDINA